MEIISYKLFALDINSLTTHDASVFVMDYPDFMHALLCREIENAETMESPTNVSTAVQRSI